MTTDYQIKALGTLRAQLLDGSSRHPKVFFRLKELLGDSRENTTEPPGRLRKSSLEDQSGECYSFVRPGSLPSGPSRSRAPENSDEGWIGEFFYDSRDAFDAFATLATDAWTLLLELPIQLPIPARVSPRLVVLPPHATFVLPAWDKEGSEPFSFAHAVNWIARAGVYPILKTELKSWSGIMTFSGDPNRFRRSAEAMSFPGSPLEPEFAQIKQPLERFFSDIPDIFKASVWAIDWLSSQLAIPESERDTQPRTSPPAPLGNKVPKKSPRKGGRPPATDPKKDKGIYEAWKTGYYKGYADLAAKTRLATNAQEVRKAIDRHRHRLSDGKTNP